MALPLIVGGAIAAYRAYKVAKAANQAYKAYKAAKKAKQVADAVSKSKKAADAAKKAADAASKTKKGAKQGCPKGKQSRSKAKPQSSGTASAKSKHAAKKDQIRKNQKDGARREREQQAELKKNYPDAKVQRERYLRDADGKIAKDPHTGTGRRVDHVVTKDGKVIEMVETTGPGVNKAGQLAKETRIIQNGGKFIRDADTKQLIPIGNQTSRVVPRP